MIRDLDAFISNTGQLEGTVILEGVRIGAERRFFLEPDRYNARAQGIDGLTGRETSVEFYGPPKFEIDRLHELIQDEGAIPPVLEKWGKQIYPSLAQKLGLPQ